MQEQAPEAGIESVVIVGAGQAGYQTAAALRMDGFGGRIVLLGDEPDLPYQRPPLSKAYLSGAGLDSVRLRDDSFFADNGIELGCGQRAAEIDRAGRTVRLESGDSVDYDHLVLALGARNRPLPVPGADLAGVVGLRTVEDADTLRSRLPETSRVAVIGGGFIGLEFAVAARKLGIEVTVVEAQPRLMPRVLSVPTGEFFQRWHREQGVRVLLGSGVTRILGEAGAATGIETSSGEQVAADLVVIGVGIEPNVELADKAGLTVDNGIVVDELLRTDDPAISAIGDCARFPSRFAADLIRLESVQNAVDQARCVSARLAGKGKRYDAVPWFWSDQGPLKLQIAGLTDGHTETVVRGDPDSGAFSVFCFRDSTLLGAESVGRAAEHMAVRRILAAERALTPAQAGDPDFDLKVFSKQG